MQNRFTQGEALPTFFFKLFTSVLTLPSSVLLLPRSSDLSRLLVECGEGHACWEKCLMRKTKEFR